MDKKINVLALGISGAIISGLLMLVLGIFGNIGLYTGAVEMMMEWHMFFSLSVLGIITGIIEAVVVTFLWLSLFGLIYNKLSK